MKTVLRTLCCVALFLGLASIASAATLTGTISDSNCGASHKQMMAEHNLKTTHDCTLACVKAGAKFVFVSEGKVYQIANQDDPDLMKHAGHHVNITGDVTGDTINVTKVAMTVAPKKE